MGNTAQTSSRASTHSIRNRKYVTFSNVAFFASDFVRDAIPSLSTRRISDEGTIDPTKRNYQAAKPIVEDTLVHPRLADHALVTGDM